MGTFVAKFLADGQLPAAKGTLFTVPTIPPTTSYVKFMNFTNVGGATETIKIYLNKTGTSRQLGPTIVLGPGESFVFDESLTLETGNLIEGETTNPASVDFEITGVNES